MCLIHIWNTYWNDPDCLCDRMSGLSPFWLHTYSLRLMIRSDALPEVRGLSQYPACNAARPRTPLSGSQTRVGEQAITDRCPWVHQWTNQGDLTNIFIYDTAEELNSMERDWSWKYKGPVDSRLQTYPTTHQQRPVAWASPPRSIIVFQSHPILPSILFSPETPSYSQHNEGPLNPHPCPSRRIDRSRCSGSSPEA